MKIGEGSIDKASRGLAQGGEAGGWGGNEVGGRIGGAQVVEFLR